MAQDPFLELLARAADAARAAEAGGRQAAALRPEAERSRRRSRLLRALIRQVQTDPHHLPLHCAWCERIEIAGEFVLPEEFLYGDLPSRLRERATHGICPDCFERETAAAAARSHSRE